MFAFIGRLGVYKTFLIVSLVALLFLSAWYFVLKVNYQEALRDFSRSKTYLINSFSEIKQIRRLLIAKGEMEKGGERLQPELYFQKQLSKAGIDFKSYHIKPPRERSYRIFSGKKKKRVIDREVEVSFKLQNGKKRFFLPRNNWFVALFNCEAGSKRWRLRHFSAKVKEAFDSKSRKGIYPSELTDEWFIEKLVFVSREPKK